MQPEVEVVGSLAKGSLRVTLPQAWVHMVVCVGVEVVSPTSTLSSWSSTLAGS